MGERKVLNKYFPPDFDPAKMYLARMPRSKTCEVRMMLPFSIQCMTCGEYMYRGKKFNSRKEDVEGEDYKGIRKFRFYIKCVTCSSEISFKTDPERGDYEAEMGCSRNFEPWREDDEVKAALDKARADAEKGDAMKVLENKTKESKREMDILDALDEMRAINVRHERVDTTALLGQLDERRNTNVSSSELTAEDEALVAATFGRKLPEVTAPKAIVSASPADAAVKVEGGKVKTKKKKKKKDSKGAHDTEKADEGIVEESGGVQDEVLEIVDLAETLGGGVGAGMVKVEDGAEGGDALATTTASLLTAESVTTTNPVVASFFSVKKRKVGDESKDKKKRHKKDKGVVKQQTQQQRKVTPPVVEAKASIDQEEGGALSLLGGYGSSGSEE